MGSDNRFVLEYYLSFEKFILRGGYCQFGAILVVEIGEPTWCLAEFMGIREHLQKEMEPDGVVGPHRFEGHVIPSGEKGRR